MSFDLPVERNSIIKVLGIGGGGNNAVNHMFERGIKDVNFIVCNTDLQALSKSPIPNKVPIGEHLTEGMGAGSRPEVGRQSALENIDDVMTALGANTKMVFITTGMGGGTGTGATPIIAKACRDAGFLTIGVVTIPFRSEGKIRVNQAYEGVNALKDSVDSLLVINNEKLREIYGDQPVSCAFSKADDILARAVKGIAEIITVTGYINVDFADVETVMKDSGVAVMGMGTATGENRAIAAIEDALNSPLLNASDITGAKSILINISSGTGDNEITMDELGEITDYIYDAASEDALIIRGISRDESLGEKLSIIVIATGFKTANVYNPHPPRQAKERVTLQPPALGPGSAPSTEEASPREMFSVKDKSEKSIVVTLDDEEQGLLDFVSPPAQKGQINPENEEDERSESKLRRLKHMQNILQKEGLSNATMKENIDTFEDVPAYVRRNISLNKNGASENKVSKFTLSTDEKNQPVIRDDNAYLNDNVD